MLSLDKQHNKTGDTSRMEPNRNSEMGNQCHHERGKDIRNRRHYGRINQLIDSQQSDFSFDDIQQQFLPNTIKITTIIELD